MSNWCDWFVNSNPMWRDYHDKEWGQPVHDDRRLLAQIDVALGIQNIFLGTHIDHYDDPEVDALKENAIIFCQKYNALDPLDFEDQRRMLGQHLGSIGEKVWIAKTFNCDNGLVGGVPARLIKKIENDIMD